MERAIGLDHLAAIARRVHRTERVSRVCGAIDDWLRRTNHGLFGQLESLLVICATTRGLDDPELHRRVRALVARERASRQALLGEGLALRRLLQQATVESTAAAPAPAFKQRLLRTAAAATIDIALEHR